MGSRKQTSTQSTTQSLPANQQRNVDSLLQGALDYFNTGGRSYFPGDTVADFDPLQTAGQNQLVGYAGGVGQDLVGSAIEGNQFFMDPRNIFAPENIPGFQGSVDALTRGYTQNLTENILPNVRSGDTFSGQFGGSAGGIGQGLAVGRSNEALAGSLENMYLGAYGQGLDTLNQAMNRAPSLFALGAAPGSLMTGVGAERQGQEQKEILGGMARHEFEQNEPAVILSLLQALTGNLGQYGGTTDTTATESTSGGGVAQALGGALSLASLLAPGGQTGLLSRLLGLGLGGTGNDGGSGTITPGSPGGGF